MRKMFDDFLLLCRRWEVDKWVHLVCGLLSAWLSATALTLGCGVLGWHPGRLAAGLSGAAVAAVLAVGKECYYRRTTGLFDRQDLVAGLVGVLLFLLVYAV